MTAVPDRPRCTATTLAGNPCIHFAVPPADVCGHHGAADHPATVASRRRVLEPAAAVALVRLRELARAADPKVAALAREALDRL